MANSYKHFKKHEELFLGLSFWALIQLGLLTILLILISSSLKLSLNSPLFILFAIIWMVIAAFIIKASLDDEPGGFYSSFLLHPLQNHSFPLLKNNQGYKSIEEVQSLKEIHHDYILNKENDLIAIIKLNNGISFNKVDEEQQKQIIKSWGDFLSQYQSINVIDSYFLAPNNFGDSIQAFIWLKPYQAKKIKAQDFQSTNLQSSWDIYKKWYEEKFSKNNSNFIADLDFYIIVKEQCQGNRAHPFIKFINRFTDIAQDEDDFFEQKNLLEQKINSLENTLKSMNIRNQRLNSSALREFVNQWFDFNSIETQIDSSHIIDKSKYLEINGSNSKKYTKTYRIASAPETGELDYWLIEYFKNLSCQSSISIHWTARDPLQDRRRAENKAEFIAQHSKNNKSSTLSLIKENRLIADELIEKPHSFDMSIFINIYCDDLKELQKIDNQIRKPIKQSYLASLDRMQIKNWLYSLPFAYNKLCNRDKLFAGLGFASSCFPFVKNELGSKAGPLLGSDLEGKPVFLDEYDRTIFNNRAINFIGDSGSGKTVAAKLAVKRRIHDADRSFYIVDNTEDGWQFFIDYFGGSIIDIDKAMLSSKALFAPLIIPENSNKDQFNFHLENIINLLSFTRENQKLSNSERNFLSSSLKKLYNQNPRPCLSDLYQLWQEEASPQSLSWLENIAPYCMDGIYSGLMDGTEAQLNENGNLVLFTFSKLDSNSSYMPIALFLIANFISKKIQIEKKTKITLIVDEAWKIFSGENSQKGKELLTHLARAGRGLDLGLWTISQKPRDLPPEIHSSASATLSFQLKEKQDRDDMVKFSNLNQAEAKLLEDQSIKESGIALFKSMTDSGLVKIELDPLENILCNSNRDFSNLRKKLFEKYSNHPRPLAIYKACKELLNESQ